MLQDSFITSPSCPVSCNPPFPAPDGKSIASIKSVSPPILVQARPMAVPGISAFMISSSLKTGFPRYFSISFGDILKVFPIALL